MEREIYQVIEGLELDEIVGGMGSDEEVIGGTQLNGGPEVSESERDCTPIIHVAWISKQSHSRIRFVLYHIHIFTI